MSPCRVCYSPYSKQIERLLRKKHQYRAIAKQYAKRFGCDVHLLEQSVVVHKRHGGFFTRWLSIDNFWEHLREEFIKANPDRDFTLRLIMTIAHSEIVKSGGRANQGLISQLFEGWSKYRKLNGEE